MENVFVISYIYPPNDKTGGDRALAIATYLKPYGFFPVILTRNWNWPDRSDLGEIHPSGENIICSEYETHNEIILPYKGNYRTNFKLSYPDKYRFISRLLYFIDRWLHIMGIYRFTEYKMFYDFLKDYYENNKDQANRVTKVIIIGAPFYTFHIGYWLKKKWNIKWLADYRDDWTTSQSEGNKYKSFFYRVLFLFEKYGEKKWVSTSSGISSVTRSYTERISSFVGVKGITIMNGFFEEQYKDIEGNIAFFSQFTIFHNGTLYPKQTIHIFLDGFKRFLSQVYQSSGQRANIKIMFIGAAYGEGTMERIEEQLAGFESFYEITPRIPKIELINKMMKSHLCLMLPHMGLKGVLSSKIFDYIISGKPVLCAPTDNDVIEDLLRETGLGIFANNEREVAEVLYSLYLEWMRGEWEFNYKENESILMKYSRRNQTKLYATLLNGIQDA